MSFTQGPRFKGNATVYFEKLIKDILQACHDKRDIQVSYNHLGEMVVIANEHLYNLTVLLQHNPDFEQLVFSSDDIQKYDAFLRDSTTVFAHIESDKNVTKTMLKIMQRAFPSLSRAEFSAIRHYTENFYAPIYHLLKHNAQQPFSNIETIGNGMFNISLDYVLNVFAEKLGIDVATALQNPQFLSSFVKEILLHASMNASALSKEIQPELGICIADSRAELEKNLENINGISLVLIPVNGQFNVCVVAYTKIISQLTTPVDLKKILWHNDYKNILSDDDRQNILNCLVSAGSFSLLEHMPSLLRTKLIGVLTGDEAISNLFFEKIIRVEEDVSYFNSAFLPGIFQHLGTDKSFQFTKTFYSTSDRRLSVYESQGLNIITTLRNPITFGKTIESISRFQDESERLLIPGQQIAYTAATKNDALNEVMLEGYPIRSIDGINPFSYNHEATLQREKDKLIEKIDNLISELKSEINSFWPYPNIKRKHIKIEALTTIRKCLAKNGDLAKCITRIEANHSVALEGKLSTRTYDLIQDLKTYTAALPNPQPKTSRTPTADSRSYSRLN